MDRATDALIRERFAVSHGVLGRWDLVAAGATAADIRARVVRGEWRECLPGAYVLVGSPETWRRKVAAACKWCGPSSVASHRSAAALHGFPSFHEGIVEVTTPDVQRFSTAAVKVHRTRTRSSLDGDVVDGIPTASPMRTLVDLCAVARLGRVEGALDYCLIKEATTIERSWNHLARIGTQGRKGMAGYRLLLAERAGLTRHAESVTETKLLRALRDRGLAGMSPQFVVTEAGEFVARLDIAFPDKLVAVELQSYRWHSSKAARVRDARRFNRLERLGWLILQYFYEDAMFDSDRVAAEIARTLRSHPHQTIGA